MSDGNKTTSIELCVHNVPTFAGCDRCDIFNLIKRIEKIEDYIKIEDRVSASDVLIRLSNIESNVDEIVRFQDITHKQYQQLIKKKTPYKCVICDGSSFSKEGMDCKACGGTCIVWV
jgi:hypothetical protein